MAFISTKNDLCTYTYIIIKLLIIKYSCAPNLQRTNYCLWLAVEVRRWFCYVLLKAFSCSQKGLVFKTIAYSYLHVERLVRQRSRAAAKNMSQNSPFLLQINKYFNVLCEACMCTYNVHAHILSTCTHIHNLPDEKESVEVSTPQRGVDSWMRRLLHKETNLIIFKL